MIDPDLYLEAERFRATPDQRKANEQRKFRARRGASCWACGRPLGTATLTRREGPWFVNVCHGGESLAPAEPDGVDHPDDLGCFPVGDDCAAKIPATHRFPLPPQSRLL